MEHFDSHQKKEANFCQMEQKHFIAVSIMSLAWNY